MRQKSHEVALLTVILFLTFSEFAAAATTNIYVSPAGNDSWSGILAEPNANRSDGPFKSLARARDAIRKLKQTGPLPDGGVTVQIRAGIYQITETFQLTDKDSGAAGTPIVYRAYRNEKAQLLGGKEIKGFTPIRAPAILTRIPLPP